MNLILDAHIVIWSLLRDPRLPETIISLIGERVDAIGFSLAQLWEVEIKIAAGRMPEIRDFSHEVAKLGLTLIPIEPADAIRAARLPRHHGDPFDRMLIAQAQARGLTIVTHDRIFQSYTVPVIWA